ncbi:MAG: SufE family protein [Bacteroidales bacterium]|nr:SufE family protein [Bacteroidales bacterium]
MSSIQEKGAEIVQAFNQFGDWMDRYNYLIELGKSMPPMDANYKTKQYLISGCQSQVWLHAFLDDGLVTFTADSDAAIPKGIAAILVHVFSGERPEDIAAADLGFIDKLGLKDHLSPTRSNGLLAMIKQIKLYGVVFQAKQNRGG